MAARSKMVEKIDGEKSTLSMKEFDVLDSMIKGISSYYDGWYGHTFNDIYDIAWEVACSNIYYGEKNPNYICRCIYNKIGDVMRATKRGIARGFSIADDSIDQYLSEAPAGFEFDPLFNNYGKAPKLDPDFNEQYREGHIFFDSDTVDEIINLFERDSKEWMYVALVAIHQGVLNCSRKIYDKIFEGQGSMDIKIARHLGYNSWDRGYRNIKLRVRRRVAEYLGIGENFNHKGVA